jgi:hypothetical protein
MKPSGFITYPMITSLFMRIVGMSWICLFMCIHAWGDMPADTAIVYQILGLAWMLVNKH